MRQLARACLFLILALPGAPLHAAALPDDALIDEGSRALENGDARKALDSFEKAAKKAPTDPRAHYLQGAAYQKLGDAAQAEKAFKAALQLDPGLAEVRGELGALYLESKRFADAARELSEAVKRKPDFVDGWYNLGQAELAQGKARCPQAVAAYAKVTDLDKNGVDGWINRSVAERRCKMLDPAQASASQAVKVAPRSAPARTNLGLTLAAAGKNDDAVAALTVATKLNPEDATAWWTLGLTELERKHPKEAVTALEKARSLKPSPARTIDLGRAVRETGDLKRAEGLFREALAADPKSGAARWHLAQILAATGRCPEAKKEVQAMPPDERAPALKKLEAHCAAPARK